jgi:molybdenum cofactor guanylyltransferase
METAAGFVLAGGRSSRMGRDKAMLELSGEALLSRAARVVSQAAARVAIVGSPDRHGQFGYPVIEDLRPPGQGPLAGIEAALLSPYAEEWNLIVACDMPNLDADLLVRLVKQAHLGSADCVSAYTARGLEPLCAVYNRRVAEVARRALDVGQRKIRDAFADLQTVHLWVDNESAVANVNTPADWRAVAGEA